MPADDALRIDDEGRVRLAGRLDFTTVPAIVGQGRELFAGRQEATVDLTDVTRADSAALALLLEWQRVAVRSGCRLRFEHVPAKLHAIADVCGVETVLEFPSS